MKFVRTKKKVFELLEINNEGNYKVKTNDVLGFGYIEPKNVVRVGDTPEDVCDDYILSSPYRFKRPKTASELDKGLDEMLSMYQTPTDKIFGGIWIEHEHGEPILKAVMEFDKGKNVTLF